MHENGVSQSPILKSGATLMIQALARVAPALTAHSVERGRVSTMRRGLRLVSGALGMDGLVPVHHHGLPASLPTR
jgi:hypothetical protein